MKKNIRGVALILCTALLLVVSGCNNADTTWVYNQDGDVMPAGLYLQYMTEAYSNARYQQMQETAESEELSLSNMAVPPKKEVLAGEVEGQPAADWIMQSAHTNAMQYFGARVKAEEVGFTLEQDRENLTEDYVDLIWNGALKKQGIWEFDGADYEEMGISQSSLLLYFEDADLRSDLFLHLYGEGGESAVPTSELKAAFVDSYAKGSYFIIPKGIAGEEGDQADEDAKAKQAAEEYLGRLKDGEEIEELSYESYLVWAGEDAQGEKPKKGDLDLVLQIADASNYGATGDAIVGASPGEIVMVEQEIGYYIVQRHDLAEDTQAFEKYQNEVLRTLKEDEYNEMLLALGESLGMKENANALSLYTVKDLRVK